MTPVLSVRLIAENLPEHRILEAIFRTERESGAVQVSSFLTSSAALGAAELYLLEYPEIAVALILNADTKDGERIEERRQTIRRILGRVAPNGWHLTLAIPKVDDWIMADPRIRAIFDADPVTRENRYERAVRIGKLAKDAPLNREEIGRAFPEFQALVQFIGQSIRVPQPTA